MRDLLFYRAQLAAIVESSADAIFSRGLDGTVLTWNGGAERMFGYRADEIVGRKVDTLVSPRAGLDIAALLSAVAGGEAVLEREMLCLRKEGTEFTVLTTVSPIRDEQGTVVAAATVVHDITEHKRVRQELDRIFELSPDMICTANSAGFFIRTNPAFQRVLGYDRDTLHSVPFLEFVHPEDREKTQLELARLAAGGTTFSFNNRYRTQCGDYRWLEWHAQANTEDGVIHAVARDGTERRVLERQLQQAQRMEAIGQLAGGVAHDFNNIITAINGFSDLALDGIPQNDPVRADIREVRAAADRAAGLTRQLLAFSRRQILTPELIDLRTVVDNMSKMLRRIIGEDIELRVESASDLGRVWADRGQIEQVVMNLAANARDAMPTGGALTVSLQNVDRDAADAAGRPGAKAGPHVVLAMADAGCGMSEDVRVRVFEPFFTTKAEGHGTGLGLATVYGIVKQSDGSIWVSSEPGRGSTFEIFLPRVEAQATGPQTSSTARATAVLTGSETVLVVEDQAEVRAVVTHTLRRAGYVVLAAAGASEAIAIMIHEGDGVALLLTDVVMPSMNGADLAARLTTERPRLRVLYMSGYTDDAVIRHGVLRGEMGFLQKPFSGEQLLTRVRAAIDRP